MNNINKKRGLPRDPEEQRYVFNEAWYNKHLEERRPDAQEAVTLKGRKLQSAKKKYSWRGR